MRAGGCTVQQTLTAEAASVVKHAVGLAQKRGHAQVTPLHVAAALLAPGASLLRQACLKSQPHSTSHPLQCRALELCFNVALNRLPTAAASPPVHGQPSLSNALVAALKRAQAHQRRGCLEQQQQPPLLAVKVEMEQLIISILDDPSVSRVMREAGFSSIFVKNKIEETVSSFVFHSSFDNNQEFSVSPSRSGPNGAVTENADIGSGMPYAGNGFVNNSGRIIENPAMGCESLRNEDAERVLEVLLGNKTRRNTVIVGDCLATTENVAREVINRVKRGDVPDPLRAVRFINLPFSCNAFRHLCREEVEQKLKELKMEVSDCLGRGPVVIYGGDLKWAVDVREQNDNDEHYDHNFGRDGVNEYSALQHIIMELRQILGSHGESRRLWLIATANYQTYMRCRMGHPSLETLWGLQAVPVPSGGLTLTLQASSTGQVKSKTSGIGSDVLFTQNLLWPTPPLKTADSNDDGVDTLSCCLECRANYEAEAEFEREQVQRSSSNDRDLSFWPQQSRETHLAAQVEAKLSDLLKKWNQTCRSRHSHSHSFDPMRHQRPSFESPQHTPDLVSRMNPPLRSAPQTYAWSEMSSPLPSTVLPPAWSDHQRSWSTPENVRDSSMKLAVPAREPGGFDVKTTLALGFTQTDSKRSNEDTHHYSGSHHFAAASSIRSAVAANHLRQFDTESVKEFCERLTEKVPWQGEENVHAIVSAILQCRAGMVRRESNKKVKEEVWLLVLGPDRRGKMKMAQAVAETVFGSQDKLVCFTSPWSRGRVHDDDADFSSRGKTYLDRLTERIACDPHCVVLVEEIDKADGVFMAAILRAMERGKLMDSNGREVSLSDVIVFMTSSVGAKYFPKFRSVKGVQFDEERLSQAIAGPSCSFKLALQEGEQEEIETIWGNGLCKRKAEWDPMKDERTEKRRSPLLDLNAEADEGNGSIAINLTLQTDTLSDPVLCSARDRFSHKFMESLDRCIVFRPFNFAELAESLLEILHQSYGRASNGRGSLEVETSVLERMVSCCWEMAPSGRETFEKWVEDVFEQGLAQLLCFNNLRAQSIVKLSPASENNNRDFSCPNSLLPATLEIGGCSNYESMGSLLLLSKLHRYNSSSKSLVQVHG